MNVYPDLAQAKTYEGYEKIPLCYCIPASKDTTQLCHILKNVSPNVFVLESCENSQDWGRYSFFGYDPLLELLCKDHQLKVTAGTTFTTNSGPHEMIRQILKENKSPKIEGMPPFTGGLVGYFSYEFLKYHESRLDFQETEEGFQDVDLMLFDKVIALDHLEKKIICIANISTKSLETSYNKGIETLKAMAELVEQGKEHV